MLYKVYWTETFRQRFDELPKAEQERIETLIKKLTENPRQGKPLGVYNIREKRIGVRRVYYIVYDKYVIVLMVAISGKKDQQLTITR